MYNPGNVPSREDVSEMQKLIDLMNGNNSQEETPSVPGGREPLQETNYSNNGTADMKRILESFSAAAGDAFDELTANHGNSSGYPIDSSQSETTNLTRTQEGAVIGSWEVRAKLVEGSNKRKEYDILHPATNTLLFSNVVIFEAAHAIVRYLNKGLPSTHPKITEIMDIEEIYRRNRQDANVFKKRYTRCIELEEIPAAEVFEARYHKARAQALAASDSLKTILQNIR